MTRELDSRIKELCELITRERDSHVFLALVAELNQRFEEKDRLLDGEMKLASNTLIRSGRAQPTGMRGSRR
jgi:hypothetical protein